MQWNAEVGRKRRNDVGGVAERRGNGVVGEAWGIGRVWEGKGKDGEEERGAGVFFRRKVYREDVGEERDELGSARLSFVQDGLANRPATKEIVRPCSGASDNTPTYSSSERESSF